MTKKKPKAELQKRGAKPTLNAESMEIIRDMFLNGSSWLEISKELEVTDRTIRNWRNENYFNLSDKIRSWKHEQMLEKAEQNLNEIANIKIDKKNTPLLKIVADKSQYLTETLGKANYSKSIEHTGTIKHEQTLLTDEQKDIMLELLQEQKKLKESNVPKTLEIIDVECE